MGTNNKLISPSEALRNFRLELKRTIERNEQELYKRRMEIASAMHGKSARAIQNSFDERVVADEHQLILLKELYGTLANDKRRIDPSVKLQLTPIWIENFANLERKNLINEVSRNSFGQYYRDVVTAKATADWLDSYSNRTNSFHQIYQHAQSAVTKAEITTKVDRGRYRDWGRDDIYERPKTQSYRIEEDQKKGDRANIGELALQYRVAHVTFDYRPVEDETGVVRDELVFGYNGADRVELERHVRRQKKSKKHKTSEDTVVFRTPDSDEVVDDNNRRLARQLISPVTDFEEGEEYGRWVRLGDDVGEFDTIKNVIEDHFTKITGVPVKLH